MDAHAARAPVWDAGEAGREKASEGAGHACCRDVDADAEEELLALVERAEVEGEAGHGATLEYAEDGSRHEETWICGDEGGT